MSLINEVLSSSPESRNISDERKLEILNAEIARLSNQINIFIANGVSFKKREKLELKRSLAIDFKNQLEG